MTHALIDILEAVPEGDRKLDAAVAVALFDMIATDDLVYAALARRDDHEEPGTFWRVSRSGRQLQTAPPYTTSVDTAITAIPEGWRIDFIQNSLSEDYWTAGLYRRDPPIGGKILRHAGSGRTAPLALCVATLKARAGG